MGRRRRHSREFKVAAVARFETASDVAALAAELGVDRGLLSKWNKAFRSGGFAALRFPGERASPDPLAGGGGACTTAAEVPALAIPAGTTALERKVVQQALELDFFRAALRQVAGSRRKSGGPGGTGSTP